MQLLKYEDMYSICLLFWIKSSNEPKVCYYIRSRKVLCINKMSSVKLMFFGESQQNEDILNHENRQE